LGFVSATANVCSPLAVIGAGVKASQLSAEASYLLHFKNERARLIAALGLLQDGGSIEDVRFKPPLTIAPGSRPEIGFAAWPFPLEAPQAGVLTSLGYRPQESGNQRVERFTHGSHPWSLCVLEAGSMEWTEYRTLSAYLLSSAYHPRDTIAISAGALRDELAAKSSEWWIETRSYEEIHDVVKDFRAFHHPWWVASGWAVDLFLGKVTRLHGDADIAFPRTVQLELQSSLIAKGWTLLAPNDGKLEPWMLGEALELPRHQAHAYRPDGSFVDLLFSEVSDGLWRFRRNLSIVRTMDRAVMVSADGIPYLAPEIVLLFKSRNHAEDKRLKDREDFEKVAPLLEPERRTWLQWAITVLDLEHPWLERLDG